MKVTIEKIKDKKYTVVWRDEGYDFICQKYKDSRLNLPVSYPNCYLRFSDDLGVLYYDIWVADIIKNKRESVEFYLKITALPALPRNPKLEDAPLMFRYMAEGLIPVAEEDGNIYTVFKGVSYNYELEDTCECWFDKITHCIDLKTDEIVEVAIDEQ